jgi:hypothetical protein
MVKPGTTFSQFGILNYLLPSALADKIDNLKNQKPHDIPFLLILNTLIVNQKQYNYEKQDFKRSVGVICYVIICCM